MINMELYMTYVLNGMCLDLSNLIGLLRGIIFHRT